MYIYTYIYIYIHIHIHTYDNVCNHVVYICLAIIFGLVVRFMVYCFLFGICCIVVCVCVCVCCMCSNVLFYICCLVCSLSLSRLVYLVRFDIEFDRSWVALLV